MICCNGSERLLSKTFFLLIFSTVVVLIVFQFKGYNINYIVPSSGWVHNSRHPLEDSTKEPDSATEYFDMEPDVDRRITLSGDLLLQEIQRRMPSLPIVYMNKYKNKPMNINATCAKLPSVFDLEFNNIYWQTLRSSNGTFQLYGAYYDVREENPMNATIRILGMINSIQPIVETHCQIWYDGDNKPLIVKTFEYQYIWYKSWGNYKNGIYQPYLISCQIPESYRNLVPSSVRLVEKPCDTTTNNLRVIYDKPAEKKDFAVCVKGLDFLHEDLSVQLVEWIELLGLVGADKIYFYELQVHPNITKVLDYYTKTGQVSVTSLSLAGQQPNIPTFQHMYLKAKISHKRQNELIPYNDCFYKNMYKYKYIVLLDIDEIIMPLNKTNWKELMDVVLPKALKIKAEERASYNVRNVYFVKDFQKSDDWIKGIPKYTPMLQYVHRVENFSKPGAAVKCFHNTEKVLTLHNHYPISCLSGSCSSYPIETTDAQMQHYKTDCDEKSKKDYCQIFMNSSIIDTSIWKYKIPLIAKVSSTLRDLGYFESSCKNDVLGNI